MSGVLPAIIALCESLQLTIIVSILFSFVPIKLDQFVSTLFLLHQRGIRPERETLFYWVFVFGAIAVYTLLLRFLRKGADAARVLPQWRMWLATSIVCLLPQLAAIYFVWVFPQAAWARPVLYGGCILAVLLRIFWPEARAVLMPAWTMACACVRSIPPFSFAEFRERYERPLTIGVLASAMGIQVFLLMFAVCGLSTHAAVWPPHDGRVYAALVMLASALAGGGFFWACRLSSAAVDRLAPRAWGEAVLTFLLLSALFKMRVYFYQPLLAQDVYQWLLAAALLNKVCWPFLERFGRAVCRVVLDEANRPALKVLAQAGFVIFIFLFLRISDPEAAVARVFMGEQEHHNDASLMHSAWAYHSGSKLDVDVNCRYGVGFAVMTSHAVGLFGGFSYLNVFLVVMYGCIIYYVAAYAFLRAWLNSVPLAIAGILMGLKMQMFHDEAGLMYMTNPGTTVMRNFFDIPFLFCIFFFLQTRKNVYLVLSSLLAAVALFYAIDTGTYLLIAYYAFLFLMLTMPAFRRDICAGRKDIPKVVLLAALPLLGALFLLRVSQGPGVFTAQFWHNMTEFARFMVWYGPIPLADTLRAHQWWAFGMGMAIAAAYVFTLIFVGGRYYFGRTDRKDVLVLVLCVYGLGLYHYYINRSAPTNYYTVILPYVFILCFWIQRWAARFPERAQKKMFLIFIPACLYCLMTMHLAVAYPNAFTLSRNPHTDPLVAQRFSQGKLAYFNFLFIEYPDAFKLPLNSLGEKDEAWRTEDSFGSDAELKDYFRREFSFPEDTALIKGLTAPDEPVALLSSFEIQMLIQADRKPFFYIFPLLNSRPMRMRLVEVTHMWTTTQLQQTMGQLETQKPPYVFMERLFLADQFSQAYLYDMPGFLEVLFYIREHYVPYRMGKFLVAMKLKDQ